LREEPGHLFPGQLSEGFVANMAGTHERLEAFSRHGSSEILEDGVADAGDRLSAVIMRTAFESLDDGAASVAHDGGSCRRENVSRKRVMTSFGAVGHERPRCRRKGRPSPEDKRVTPHTAAQRRHGTAPQWRRPRHHRLVARA